MKTAVGIYEAKTRLAALLRQVAAGKRFTITNRGKAVAELGPPVPLQKPAAKRAIEAFQDFRKANPVRQKVNIKALIEVGRE
jgi:antitoxin (DNA-binding transcriptional repressor) of toxin-antitoxin stability system